MNKREYVNDLLTLCTPEQANMFNRMYPDGPNIKQIDRAIEQIKATILGLNKDVQNLRNIRKEFEAYKKETAEEISSLNRELEFTKRELSIAYDDLSKIKNPIDLNNLEVQQRLDLLDALKSAGVDNWEWYDEAISSIRKVA